MLISLPSLVALLRSAHRAAPRLTPVCLPDTHLPPDRVPLTQGFLSVLRDLPPLPPLGYIDLALAAGLVLTTEISLPQAQALHWLATQGDDLVTLERERYLAEVTDTGDIWAIGLDPEAPVVFADHHRQWRSPFQPELHADSLALALKTFRFSPITRTMTSAL